MTNKQHDARAAATPLKAAIVPVTPFEQNCSLIWNSETKAGAVVDPGGDVDHILDAIGQVGLAVERIVLTHGHIDHAGGAAELKERLGGGVPIVGPHRADAFLLRGIEAQGRQYRIDGVRNVEPDRYLDEADPLEIGGQPFEIRHCPGHSPGSLVYIDHAQRFILMGDVLFRGSIGRTDFPYGDHAALISAIRSKLLVLDDDYSFLCGHGPPSTIGDERRTNPFIAE